ncbi:MAG: lysophospholipase [Pseudonocardiaceae bacterium]
MSEHVDGYRDLPGGTTAYWQGWVPPGERRAVVVLVHGLGEHGGRYAHVGRRLAEAGLACYCADHRGHGRTEGPRANVGRMTHVVADLAEFVTFATEPGVPTFMLGHSMGGLLALLYATTHDHDLAGLVLTGAYLQVTQSSALKPVAKLLSTLTPNLGVVPVIADAVSRDPQVVTAYRTDPLVHHGKVPVRTGAELLTATRGLPARLARLEIPVLILHGTDDRIATPEGSRMVHRAVSSPDRTLRLYDGLFHEVLNEPEGGEILDEVVGWMSDRIR